MNDKDVLFVGDGEIDIVIYGIEYKGNIEMNLHQSLIDRIIDIMLFQLNFLSYWLLIIKLLVFHFYIIKK